jgi:hypothetical protein
MIPDGAGTGTIAITPAEVQAAATTFADQQSALERVWSALDDALRRDQGMAGNDGGARTFAGRYDPAAAAAWRAFGAGIRVLGGIATGLTTTANNYLRAEAHSTAGGRAPDRFAPPAVFSDVMMPGPAPAMGAGHSDVPDVLARFWPNGDPGRLRDAATAWRAAQSGLTTMVGLLHDAVNRVTNANSSDDLRAMGEFWDSLAGGSALFTTLPQACGQLAAACDGYAAAIDKAHHDLEVALAEIGVAVVVTTAVGVLLSVFTLGGSDVAAGAADAAEVAAVAEPVVAEFEVAVAAEVEGSIAADVAASLDVVEAETAELDSTIEQELAETEGETAPPRTPVTPGNQAAADILEPGGEPIGEPGTSPDIRTMSQEELEQTWQKVVDEYGPPRTQPTPKGDISYVETPDGGRIQLRPFSKSGGPTIDINIDGVDVTKIHVK